MKKIFDFVKKHALKFFSLVLTFSLMLFGIAIPGMNAATPSSEYSAIQNGNAVNCIYVTEDHLCDLMTYMHNQYNADYEGSMDLITLSNGFKLRAEWSYDDRNEDWPDQLIVYSVFQDATTGWDNDSAYVIINGYRVDDSSSKEFELVEYGDYSANVYSQGVSMFAFEVLDTEFGSPVESTVSNINYNGITYYCRSIDETPVLSGGETAYVTNVDDPMSCDEIKATLKAIDNEDGDISSKIVVETDNYSSNKNKVGTYSIVFAVTDNAGNKSTLTVSVYVTDTQAATITGPTTYAADEKKKTSTDTLKGLLTFTDNYYDASKLTITVESDNYSSNYNKLGTYAVTFKCVDGSGNISRHTINVTVNDTTSPVFSGPTSIIKNQSVDMTLADIKGQITASDNGDGVITNKITVKTDNYTGSGNKKGSYTIVFQVSDTAGNTATHTVTVQVKDDIPPVWYVPNYCIKVSQLETLTRDDIVDILVASGQIAGSSEKSVNFTVNEYEGNENEPGMYSVGLQVRSSDGTQSDINLFVEVLEDEEADIVVPGDDETPSDDEVIEKQWYEVVGDWFVSEWLGLAIWVWFVFGGALLLIVILIIVASSKDKGYRHYNRRRY